MVTLVWQKTEGYNTQYTMDQTVINANSQQEALGIALDKDNPRDGRTLFMRASVNLEQYILNATGSDTGEQ